MRRVLESLLLAWLVHASPSHADSLIETVAEFTASLSAESADTPREIALVAQRFEAAGLAARIGQAPTLTDAELAALFTAADHAMFYTFTPAFLARMERVHALLEARGVATDEQRESMHRGYVQLRRFDAARRFAAAHPTPGVPTLPAIIDKIGNQHAGPSEWRFNHDASTMTRVPLDLRGVDVLVISHPQCGFSQRAATEIAADAELRAIFQRSHWLAPQDGRIDPQAYAAWNDTHRAFPLAMLHEGRELPFVETRSTPRFYFLRDGQVAATVIGWPKEGRREELIAAARR